jgi:hypothetical protein
MRQAPGPASTAEAMAMLDAAFGHLSGTDWAGLGWRAQGEVLAGLRGAQAKLTAVHALVLAAFTAASGYEPDGHGSAKARYVS